MPETAQKYARAFGLPEDDIAHADYNIITNILTVTYGIDQPRYKQKKVVRKATKEFADYFQAPIFIGKGVDYILTAYLKAKGGVHTVRESRGISKLYYTSTDPVFGKITMKQFIETEVEERGNYSVADVQNWIRKYGLSMNDLAIWVSPKKWVANRYNLFAEEWDEAEKIPESEMRVYEIKGNEGFIIPESDDGDEGYLFVFKRNMNHVIREGTAPGQHDKLKEIIEDIIKKPISAPEKRDEIRRELTALAGSIDRSAITELRNFRPLGMMSEFGAAMGAEPRKGVKIDTPFGPYVFDEKRVPSKERVDRWYAQHKEAEGIRTLAAEYAFGLGASPNTVTGNFRVVERGRRFKEQGMLSPEEEQILNALEKYWQDHPEFDRQKGYGVWGHNLEIMVPESLRKNMTEKKGSLIDAILKASPGEVIPIEYKDVPLGKRILLPSNITGSEIQRRGDLIVVAVQVDRDIVAYLYVQKGSQLIQIRPIPWQKTQVKPGELVNTIEYNMWVERIKKEAPEYLPEWETTTAGIRAGDTIIHKTAKYTAVVDKVYKNGNIDITVLEAKGIPEWEKSIKEGFPIKTTVKGADIDRYFEKAVRKGTEEKQPWQMTRSEAIAEASKPLGPMGISWGEMRTALSTSRKFAESLHKDMVKLAIVEGKPVPAEVLKDYPDLIAKKKEPWEMTYREFADFFIDVWGEQKFTFAERVGKPLGIQSQAGEPYHMIKGKRIGYSGSLERDRWRLAIVDKALSEGKKVPEEILAELSESLKHEREKLGGNGMAEQYEEKPPGQEVRDWMKRALGIEDYKGGRHDRIQMLALLIQNSELGNIRSINEAGQMARALGKDLGYGEPPAYGKSQERYYAEKIAAETGKEVHIIKSSDIIKPPAKPVVESGAIAGGTPARHILRITEPEGYYFGTQVEVMQGANPDLEPYFTGTIKRLLNNGELVEVHPEGDPREVSFRVPVDRVNVIRLVQQEGAEPTKIKKLYRYYYLHRPPGIGTQPEGFINYESWLPAATTPHGRTAFGWVEYDRPLTPEETSRYELFEDEVELPKLVKELVQFAHDEGIDEAMKAIVPDDEYYRAVMAWLKAVGREKLHVHPMAQVRDEVMRLAGIEKEKSAEWKEAEKILGISFDDYELYGYGTRIKAKKRYGDTSAEDYIILSKHLTLPEFEKIIPFLKGIEEARIEPQKPETKPTDAQAIHKRAKEVAEWWFNSQMKNPFTEFYLYHKAGDFRVAIETPEGYKLSDAQRISPAWTKEQAEQWIYNTAQRLPILPLIPVAPLPLYSPRAEPTYKELIRTQEIKGWTVKYKFEWQPAMNYYSGFIWVNRGIGEGIRTAIITIKSADEIPNEIDKAIAEAERATQKPAEQPKDKFAEIQAQMQRDRETISAGYAVPLESADALYKRYTSGYSYVSLLGIVQQDLKGLAHSIGYELKLDTAIYTPAVLLQYAEKFKEFAQRDYDIEHKKHEARKEKEQAEKEKEKREGGEAFWNEVKDLKVIDFEVQHDVNPDRPTRTYFHVYDRTIATLENGKRVQISYVINKGEYGKRALKATKEFYMKMYGQYMGKPLSNWITYDQLMIGNRYEEYLAQKPIRIEVLERFPTKSFLEPKIREYGKWIRENTYGEAGVRKLQTGSWEEVVTTLKEFIRKYYNLAPAPADYIFRRPAYQQTEIGIDSLATSFFNVAANGWDLANTFKEWEAGETRQEWERRLREPEKPQPPVVKPEERILGELRTKYRFSRPEGDMVAKAIDSYIKIRDKSAVLAILSPVRDGKFIADDLIEMVEGTYWLKKEAPVPVPQPSAAKVQSIQEIKQQAVQSIQQAKTVDELKQILKGIGFVPLPEAEKRQVMDLYQNKYSILMSERPFGERVPVEEKPKVIGAPTPQELAEAEMRRKAEEGKKLRGQVELGGAVTTAARLGLFEPGAMEKAKAEAEARRRIEQLNLPYTIHPVIKKLAESKEYILKFGAITGKETLEDSILSRYKSYCPAGVIVDNKAAKGQQQRWWVYPERLRACITEVQQKIAAAMMPASAAMVKEAVNVLSPSMRQYIQSAKAIRDVVHYFVDRRKPPVRGVLYRARDGTYFVEAQDGQIYVSMGWVEVDGWSVLEQASLRAGAI